MLSFLLFELAEERKNRPPSDLRLIDELYL